MCCVFGLWLTGDQKNKIYHLTVLFFFISFHLFPPKNEVSIFKLCSERVSNMAGHRQNHILLLRGKECKPLTIKKKESLGFMKAAFMSHLTSVSSYDTAIQG